MGICGSKAKPNEIKDQPDQVTDMDRAVLDLKIQRDRLKKYQTNLNTVMEREQKSALILLQQGKRDQALLCLKKKKYQQKLIAQTNGMMIKLEKMVGDIEIAQVQKEFIDTMKLGTQMLQKMNEEMNIDDVEQLMLDTDEAIEHQRQISEMLAGNLSADDVANVDIELDAMMQEIGDEQALDIEAAMPNVPVHSGPTHAAAAPNRGQQANKVQKATAVPL